MSHTIQKSHFTYYLYYELYQYKIKYKIFNSETLKQKRCTAQGQRLGVLSPSQLLVHCLLLYSSFLWFEIFHPGGRLATNKSQEAPEIHEIHKVPPGQACIQAPLFSKSSCWVNRCLFVSSQEKSPNVLSSTSIYLPRIFLNLVIQEFL